MSRKLNKHSKEEIRIMPKFTQAKQFNAFQYIPLEVDGLAPAEIEDKLRAEFGGSESLACLEDAHVSHLNRLVTRYFKASNPHLYAGRLEQYPGDWLVETDVGLKVMTNEAFQQYALPALSKAGGTSELETNAANSHAIN